MNFLKRIYIYLLILTILSPAILKCDEFDELIDSATTNLVEPKGPKVKKLKLSSNIDVLNKLLAFGVEKILDKNFYQRTMTPLKRPITTLPIFNLYHTEHTCQRWLLNIHAFFDKIDRGQYYNSPFIESLADVDADALDKIAEFGGNTVPDVIGLFRKAKKEERRTGFNFEYLNNLTDVLSIELKTALLYEERNLFLTPDETEEVENLFPGGEKQQKKEFQKHVISDKIGFDDLKVKLGCLVLTKDNICVKVGPQATIPTAFVIKNGILGSNFLKIAKKSDPMFSFIELNNLIDEAIVDNNTGPITDYVKNFGLEAVDRLSGIAFDCPMGNDRHFGLGIFIEPKIKVNEGVTLRTLASVEYFFPAKEKRYFLKTKNPADFANLNAATRNEQTAGEAIAFLDQAVINTFFPGLYTTSITPGFIAQLTIGPKFRLREWDFAFGYDLYYQHREKINYIEGDASTLQVRRGIRPKALQNTIFASIIYNKIRPDSDWSIFFNFEEALASKGIGNNYALSLAFEINY